MTFWILIVLTASNVILLWVQFVMRHHIDVMLKQLTAQSAQLTVEQRAFNEKLKTYNGIMLQEVMTLIDRNPTMH